MVIGPACAAVIQICRHTVHFRAAGGVPGGVLAAGHEPLNPGAALRRGDLRRGQPRRGQPVDPGGGGGPGSVLLGAFRGVGRFGEVPRGGDRAARRSVAAWIACRADRTDAAAARICWSSDIQRILSVMPSRARARRPGGTPATCTPRPKHCRRPAGSSADIAWPTVSNGLPA